MTLHPELEKKKEAEKRMEELSKAPGFLQDLLSISTEESDASIKLVCSVYFRRYLERFWDTQGFSKEQMIEIFPSLLLNCSKETEKQMLLAFCFIIKTESVEAWGSLINASERLICSNAEASVRVGLLMMNKIAITFVEGYKCEKVFEHLLDRSGETILHLASQALTFKRYSIASLALKVLMHSSEGYIIPLVFMDPGFVRNCIAAAGIGAGKIREINTPGVNREECMTLCKWALALLNNMLRKATKKKAFESFSLFEDSSLLQGIYQETKNILAWAATQEDAQKLERNALMILKQIIQKDSGWAQIDSECEMLVSSFLLPAVIFSDELADLWEDGQIEFLRQQETQYIHCAATIVGDIFFEMCKKKKDRPESLMQLMSAVVREINSYSSNPTEETARMRYGGLYLIRTAAKYISSNDAVYGIVLNDLRAPHSIVRYMAFSTLQNFGHYREAPVSVLEPFMAGVDASDVAIVVESVMCLPQLLEVPALKKALTPNIPLFIQLILNLSNTVQIEALSSTLESLIMICPDETVQIAPGIASAVSQSVVQLLKEDIGDETQMDERYEVLDGYVRTIVNLIESLERTPEVALSVLHSVKPMLIEVAQKYQEFFFDTLAIIVSITYTLKNVDEMYDLLEEMLKLPHDDLLMYAREVSNVFDNYITYGKQGILKYLEQIVHILKCMVEGYTSEYDFPYVCRVLESIVLNLHSLLGSGMPAVMRTVITVALSNKEALKIESGVVAAAEVIMCAAVMEPGVGVSLIVEMGIAGFLVKVLSKTYKNFGRVHDLKLLLLFSGTLLSLPQGSLPEEVPSAFLITLMHYALVSLPDAELHRETLKKGEDYHEEYSEEEYMDEDPTFESPLDSVDPYAYASAVLSSQKGRVISHIWEQTPETMRVEIEAAAQKKK